MARQILGASQRQQTKQTSASFADIRLGRKTEQVDPAILKQELRKKRSQKYMDAMSKLDTGSNLESGQKTQELLDAIEEEFGSVVKLHIPSLLEGIVSKCYLGDPYEVHSLDMAGNIIEHYQAGRRMPGKLENVRALAMNPSYEFIEVYSDCACAIDRQGNSSIIQFD